MKIFVTGGAGFVGANLAEELLGRNHSVTVYDNLSSGKKEFLKDFFQNPRFRFIKGDILDKANLKRALKNHQTVFHLSANADIAKGVKYPRLDFSQTIEATLNLLEAMKELEIKKIFYFSGSGVYGNVKVVAEENFGPLFPISMYGSSKLSAEALIYSFVNLYDFQAWVLRPANIIGKNATHGVILDFTRQLQKKPKHLKILGNGRQLRSYLYISDVIEAVLLVFEKAKEKINLFNLSSKTFLEVNQIADLVIQEMGLKNVKKIWTGKGVGWRGDVEKVRMRNDKIKKLGWQPKYNSRQAVIKTIRVLLNKE